MGVKFIVISVQVSLILSYLDRFVKQCSILYSSFYCILIVSWELLNYYEDTFNQFTCVFIDLKIFNHSMFYKKNEYKIQVSISHTPEGTNTVRVGFTGAGPITIRKAYDASVICLGLCTTPVASGGETR